jgi:hypothetical protein
MRHMLQRLLRRAPAAVPPHGFTPITQTDASDVFIAAYPKSGSTWFQNLVAGALYGLDPEQTPDRLVQDLVPDVHYKQHYKRYRTPTFFKTHDLPRPQYRRVVYLLRDGRDVMVSFWHHLQTLTRREVDFLTLVRDAVGLPCKWHCHVNAWAANPYGAQMLVIRYEDLHADPVRQLQRCCEFAGEPRDTAFCERVAAHCTFAAMRAREQRFGWDNAAWPRDKPFIRRGLVGSYRDEMPPDVLTAFMAEAAPTLQKHGYPDV